MTIKSNDKGDNSPKKSPSKTSKIKSEDIIQDENPDNINEETVDETLVNEQEISTESDLSTDLPIIHKTNSVIVKQSTAMQQWGSIIDDMVASRTSGVVSKGQAMLVLLKAYELGIGFGNAISHIHVINGKSGIDIHIAKAILGKPGTGVSWKLTKDYEPFIQVVLANKTLYDYNKLPANAVEVHGLKGNEAQVKQLINNGKVPYVILKDPATGMNTIAGYVTEYEFTREKKNIHGEYFTETITSSFSTLEGHVAKLGYGTGTTRNPLSVWAKFEKTMVDHRAFHDGARRIASDLLLGNYSYEELLDMNDYVASDIDERGAITEIRDKQGNIITQKDIAAKEVATSK